MDIEHNNIQHRTLSIVVWTQKCSIAWDGVYQQRTFGLPGAAISQAGCPSCRRPMNDIKALNDGQCGLRCISSISASLCHSRLKIFLFHFWNLPTVAFLFFFRTNSTDSADCLPILLSMSVFYFLVFLFHLFSFWFPAADYADLCQLLSSYLLVSYRTFCLCGAAISQADCPSCRRSVSNVKALNDGKCGIEWDVILYHIYNSWIFAAIL